MKKKNYFNLLKPTGFVHQQVQNLRIIRSARTVFMCFVFISSIYILNGDKPEALHDTFNLAKILQYFTILNYELFCKRNGIPVGAHFIYLKSGSILA